MLQPIKAGQIHSHFWETEENVQSFGDAWYTFIRAWVGEPHRVQAACLPAWHMS